MKPIYDDKLTYIDLFSGCGGLALGMHLAGWKSLFAIEKNEDAFKTLKYNLIDHNNHFDWPQWLPKTTHDINNLLASYRNELQGLSGKISLVTGGPPCQGFSTAGRRNEQDDRNKLVDSYLEFIDLVQPDSLLFENVKGFAQVFKKSNNGSGRVYSDYILRELSTRGYMVSARMIDFSQYGVPQRRVRFILFASKLFSPETFFETLSKNVRPFLKNRNLPRHINIKSALSDLEKINGQSECPDSKGFKSGLYGSPHTRYQRYCRRGARKGMIPDSHRFANHKSDTIERFQELHKLNLRDRNISYLLKDEYDIKKNCFSILDENLPAPTLTSNPDDHIHYSEPRTLTVREYARIQSFPDWFAFKGKYTTGGKCRKVDVPRYTQIGNAIPPLFAEQVGLVLKHLISSQMTNA